MGHVVDRVLQEREAMMSEGITVFTASDLYHRMEEQYFGTRARSKVNDVLKRLSKYGYCEYFDVRESKTPESAPRTVRKWRWL